MKKLRARKSRLPTLKKALTGIQGLDEITRGGLPQGRPTLVCGNPGCGKTLLGVEFLVRGATQFGEPGVFVSFEETPDDLIMNVASLGFDLRGLEKQKKLLIDHVRIERSEIEETGEYDLDGLFIRLGYAIDSIKAKRIVLDTLEALFASLANEAILRSELRRLFGWLKQKGVTAIITAERGKDSLSRHGLEEYVSDCVILLDHRVIDQISTRRMRIIKYRGSLHGTNEYPFLIDEQSFSVLPLSSLKLEHSASTERFSSGVPQLDAMLGGKGYYRGGSVLVSGNAGTGKSTLAAHLAQSTCKKGKRCLYFAFEESPQQVLRNMRSVGVDLEPWTRRGLLQFHAARPTMYGLEMHLAVMHKMIKSFRPEVVIVDPVTNLINSGTQLEVQSTLTRLIDFLKSNSITALFTSLVANNNILEDSRIGVSSLMDTWIQLRDLESNGERNRGIYLLKSRGMNHSNQIREFHLTSQGIRLTEPYLGTAGVLTGSARISQEARERAELLLRNQEIERKKRDLERKRLDIESQIAALRSEYESAADDIAHALSQKQAEDTAMLEERALMSRVRDSGNNIKHASNSKLNKG